MAIGFEVGAILLLNRPPISTVWLIVLIAVDLIFAVVGSLLWKKANRLDPASEKDKVRFFLQNQLGAIISIIAFLPLVILILTNKDMNGKQKGLVGAVAVVALLVAGVMGVELQSAIPGTVRRADGAGGVADRSEQRLLDEIGQQLSRLFGLFLYQHREDNRDFPGDGGAGKGTQEHHRPVRSW